MTRLHAFCLLICSTMTAVAAEPRSEMFVLGRGSDHVVRFDLTTGKSAVLATFPAGSRPTWLAENAQGRLFVGLRAKAKNVVELVPQAGQEFTLTDVTPIVGRYGPGMLAFDSQGRLYVAGDSERVVHRYDVNQHNLIDSLDTTRGVNVVGLAIHDDVLYLAEYFQKSILRIKLNGDPLVSETLVDRSEHLTRPVSIAVGHNREVLVVDTETDVVQEFDGETGVFVATRFRAKDLGTTHLKSLVYSKPLARYFLSTDDVVVEMQVNGQVVARHQSPDLHDAAGIVVRVQAD